MSESPFRQKLLQQAKRDFHYHLGNGALAKSDFGEAVLLFGRALDVWNENAKVWFNFARALEGAGRAADAEKARQTGFSLDRAADAQALYDLSLTYGIQGQTARERELLTTVTERYGDYANAFLRMGWMLQVEGRLDAARDLFVRCVERTKGENLDISELTLNEALRVARDLTNYEKFDEAQAYCGFILRLDPENPDGLEEIGRIQHMCGHFGEAIDSFRSALATGRANPLVYSRLGTTLEAIDRLVEAEEACRAGVEAMPEDALQHVILGTILETRGNHDAAIASFERAVHLNAAFMLPRVHIARVLAAMGSFEKAEAVCRAAEDHAGEGRAGEINRAWQRLCLGRIFRQTGRLAEAVEAFREAVGLYPEFSWLHLSLGAALWRSGEPDAALSSYRTARECGPPTRWVMVYTGALLSESGRLEEARKEFSLALSSPLFVSGCVPYLPDVNEAGVLLERARMSIGGTDVRA